MSPPPPPKRSGPDYLGTPLNDVPIVVTASSPSVSRLAKLSLIVGESLPFDVESSSDFRHTVTLRDRERNGRLAPLIVLARKTRRGKEAKDPPPLGWR